MTGILDGLAKNHYRAIAVDPPWSYKTYSEKGDGRGAVQHYDTMTLADIKALDVKSVADKDAALFLWVTDTHLEMAFDVLAAWGFRYKTVAFYWVKLNKNGSPFVGLGHWTRANPETCLLATRGSPHRLSADVARLIMSPRREHSRKPDETFERIMRLVRGPYLDLFGRQQRPAWTVAGDQPDKFPMRIPADLEDVI
jgi:N6-adenosine-specific RNA methylase IME4